jgi:hypothetical protein
MKTYADVIKYNPVAKHSMNGYQLDRWYNFVQKPNAGIVRYNISMFANTASDASRYAMDFKQYLEANGITVRGIKDDVSVGLTKPVLDRLTRAYVVDIIMLAGQLRMYGSSSVPKQHPNATEKDIVHNGIPLTHNGKQLTY